MSILLNKHKIDTIVEDNYWEGISENIFDEINDSEQKKEPIKFSIVNRGNQNKTAVLFGANENMSNCNYGSDTSIEIKPTNLSNENVPSYLEVLKKSQVENFKCGLIRIQSANSSQLHQLITLTHYNENGKKYDVEIIPYSYSAYGFQQSLNDIPYHIEITGDSSLSFTVLANTSLTITLFPEKKINYSFIQNYSAPQIIIKPKTLLLLASRRH